MFWLCKKEIEYIDILSEWRKEKVWNYNRFDKVIITEVAKSRDKKYIWEVMILLKYTTYVWDELYYKWILKSGVELKEILKVKPYRWQFQDEFDKMDKVVSLSKETKVLQKELIEKSEELMSINKDLNETKTENLNWIHTQV